MTLSMCNKEMAQVEIKIKNNDLKIIFILIFTVKVAQIHHLLQIMNGA